MATVQFLGAAQEVTGSCHHVGIPGIGRILLDCGMHQGGDAVDRLGNETFDFDAPGIDALVLSHAHMDHSGLLPILVRNGFRGPILCTRETAELLPIMLEDAAGLYERDLERKNRQLIRKGKPPIEPLYTREDLQTVYSLCLGIEYQETYPLLPGLDVTLFDAGHILGSAIVQLQFTERNQTKKLVFSGDLGKKDTPLMNDPIHLSDASIVLMESTYGDRNHRSMPDSIKQLEQVLSETWAQGGNVLIPAFAVGRTQEVLYHLGAMHQRGTLDGWQIYLDTPMGHKVTQVYDHWLHTLDCDGVDELCDTDTTFLKDFLPRLSVTSTTDESMAINRIKSGALIIAGSGMCTGGRIRHHFKNRIWDRKTTVIFCGYQAQGTLGRLLVDGLKTIKMFGDEFVVNARIETIGGFSAHAGQQELLDWAAGFTSKPDFYLVHGEPKAQDTLASKLWEEHGIKATIPKQGQTVVF
ncbi:MBL fold metallo-hydrolase RNA specificity domain-containing protein [Saccharospirillum sp.]|uniref:MBL fold metallo-hydrolase RNA specificity domain-containing protein n=1 Tax=Saccharospirillum sp. TaxID=2033801 RepID=UPI0034A014AB